MEGYIDEGLSAATKNRENFHRLVGGAQGRVGGLTEQAQECPSSFFAGGLQKLTFIMPGWRFTIPNANAKKLLKERVIMKSNSVMVPEAKEAMERFKMESASEVDVPSPS